MTPERLAEINALAQGDPWVIGRELVEVVNAQEAEIAAARALLHRLVDHEDIGCMLDHHGYCQEHGLSAAPCAVAEARRHLAGTTQTITTVTKETASE